jgi:hypothetical protein
MGLIFPPHKFRLSGYAIVDHNDIDGNHLIVTCTLHNQGNIINAHVLIDCGTASYAFIDEDYIHHHQLRLHLLKLARNLTIIDGRPVTLGTITDITHTHLTILNHQGDISLFVTKLEYYPIVLNIL